MFGSARLRPGLPRFLNDLRVVFCLGLLKEHVRVSNYLQAYRLIMKLISKLVLALLMFIAINAHALEEPPGAQSQEDADLYLAKLAQDQAEGKIYMDKGVEKSWEKAAVFIPGSIFQKSISSLKFDKKHPVLIYLHGCSGITRHNDLRWGQFASEQGFVAILPDSLARPGRISNCDPSTSSTTFRFPMALIYREQEIAYAMQELKKLSWVDQDNIFLMGHSEGSNASAVTRIRGFKGIILSSAFCHHGVTFDGSAKGLVINFLSDPWHQGVTARCSKRLDNKPLEVIHLEGAGHDTFDVPLVRKAVGDFLK